MNIDEIMDARRKVIAETIKTIDAAELRTLTQSLFSYPDHPWLIKLTEFISTHERSTFYHATTNDHIQIIYSDEAGKGMWCLPGQGMGLLQTTGLTIMKEIVAGKK